LIAICTLALAVAPFFCLDVLSGCICCDNIAALKQSSKACQWVWIGMKHSDLHWAIRNLKCSTKMSFRYSHVRAHQDRIKAWSKLALEEQLNVLCNELSAGARFLSECTGSSQMDQFVPLSKAAKVLDSVELTTDVGPEVRFCLGKEEIARFYTAPKELVNRGNTGGLGLSPHRFNQVCWGALESALRAKPDMF
jgi:hypothetical protein